MLAKGTVLQGRYRVAAPLGQGGMAAVYRVWDLRLNAPLALKEMTPQPGLDAATLTQLRRQFEQEASVLANLSHPFLVDVTDYFEEGGNDYLVMKFVEGESLADCIERDGALPEDRVLEWADQLLAALDYCHRQGVIHRDVKPQNVIIHADGHAVLVDFGLVKLWDPSDPRTRTAMRGMGTPEYAPPEQYSTQASHTDPRSDIYGLGATLYHALTGQAPVEAVDRLAAVSPFPEARDPNPRVSAKTNTAISQAMELPVHGRFQSAAEMRAALQGDADTSQSGEAGPVVGPAAPPPKQATKLMPSTQAAGAPWWKHVPTWGWVVLGGAVLLGVGLALGASGGGPAAVAPIATVVPTTEMTPTATPTPSAPSPIDIRTRSADGMVMVYVPAGEFTMGSTDEEVDNALALCNEYYGDCERDWFERELPPHLVALDGFWIDRTEVTNAQFAAFLNEEGNQEEGDVTWLDLESEYCLIERVGGEFRPKSGYGDHPVVKVSWYGAAAYCQWAGGQLPTEAQWEYAARGQEGRMFPWGDELDGTRLNYCDATCDFESADESFDDGYARTAPVGSYPDGASWVGALDLAGNVWEWGADWYGAYPSGRQENPSGPSVGDYRVERGGSRSDFWYGVRAAARHYGHPDFHDYVLGFRCVGSPGE